jgi:hypothetical protein
VGDGSAAHGNMDSFVLTLLSGTRFGALKTNQAKITYRWCSAKLDIDPP